MHRYRVVYDAADLRQLMLRYYAAMLPLLHYYYFSS